jgi:mutator protein MutT
VIKAARREIKEEVGMKDLVFIHQSHRTHSYIWNNVYRSLRRVKRFNKGQRQQVVYFSFDSLAEDFKLNKNIFVKHDWVDLADLRNRLHPERGPLISIVEQDWSKVIEPVSRVSRAIILDDQNRVLLGKRTRNGGVGQWALIGGRPDKDETAEQAVVREVKEEVGLDFLPKFYAEIEDKIAEQNQAWLVTFFSGSTKGELKFDPNEVSEIIWAAPQDLDNLDITFNHKEILQEFYHKHESGSKPSPENRL